MTQNMLRLSVRDIVGSSNSTIVFFKRHDILLKSLNRLMYIISEVSRGKVIVS